MYNNISVYEEQAVREQSRFISKVYGWMCFALCITGLVAWLVGSNPGLAQKIAGNQVIFFGLIIAELGLVFALAGFINKMRAATATAVFIVYSLLNGLTLSVIFTAYTMASLGTTFLVTAGTFGVMSAYGYFTKRDLTTIGNLCFMCLFGLIIASIVNMFWANSILYWVTTYAGVIIFVGLTAYDTQKIKEMGAKENISDTETCGKAAIIGALALYLDFINLFLFLLRLFGRRD